MYLDDTWEFDGVDWVEISTIDVPDARTGAGMDYDTSRRKTVLFGGSIDSGEVVGDTWEYDGSNWVDTTSGSGPVPRVSGSLIYDSEKTAGFFCLAGIRPGLIPGLVSSVTHGHILPDAGGRFYRLHPHLHCQRLTFRTTILEAL